MSEAGAERDGLRALVTGGTKGIGQAVATRLRENGATVLTTARTSPVDLAEADHFIAADVTTAEGCAMRTICNSINRGSRRGPWPTR
jgi:NAD(P)-dependent dehydrogenase (short-subunit alcohol dehydrogenase family)